ncbi:general substrate transporter [Thozetella sp. PMI_491]|nr:general substrate transporter [Thozetella sp. PMI_491]
MGKRLGTFRATYLAAIACTGSFLFAYDTGIIGGILTLPAFKTDFNTAGNPNVASNSTSLLQAGAFFACFFIWPFTARFGRRWSIALASTIFCIGAVIQTVNTHSLGAFYAARVISGIGVGMATVIIPMYTAEMSPKHIRGSLGSLFQFFFTLGVMTSYWIDYGVSIHVAGTNSAQWQIPVGLQLLPGGILGLGMLLTRESTRWLATKGRNEEAQESLIWVRGGEDTVEVREEFEEILASIREEERVTEGYSWKELLLPVNRQRVALIIALQIGVQLTGNTSLAYYAPQIFTAIGAGSNNLFFTGFFGLAKVVACGFFVLFLIERVGRRGSLMVGALLMGTYMLIVALLVKTHPPDPKGPITSTAVAAVTMVYLEAMSYNISWGPVPWLYMAEIMPSRIREGAVAIGTATQWLFNFVFSQVTPIAVTNLGWKTFLMFCIFNWSLVVFAFLFVKETKGKSLEEMEALFGAETAIDIETAHQRAKEQILSRETQHDAREKETS